MTLLERWDDSHNEAMQWAPDEIRRAIAIAQAVEWWDSEIGNGTMLYTADLRTKADELLCGGKK